MHVNYSRYGVKFKFEELMKIQRRNYIAAPQQRHDKPM